MNFKRSSGILLHPTSLPGKYGIGSLGKEAYDFVNFLIESQQKLWQVCPLGPTGYGDSPYQCFSAFAGNPLLINIDKLVEENLLSEKEIPSGVEFDEENVEFGRVIEFKYDLYRKAFSNFKKNADKLENAKFKNFVNNNKSWLEDYSLFMAIKNKFGGNSWEQWPDDVRVREEEVMADLKEELSLEIEFYDFIQYLFFKQWLELKAYANRNGIKIVGDIPIFVAFDSADAWSNPDIFLFDENRKPVSVAGVPPDYFSETGQLWGNPLYDWEALKETNFKWWIERIEANLVVSDILRIDHFRGFAAYWAVPYGEDTAINGTWEEAAGEDLFDAIEAELGNLPIIAEDLGLITPDVVELRDKFEFPGMKILQFAFDSAEDTNLAFLPHYYPQNSVVYTGTHDNETFAGWFENAKEKDRKFLKEYLECDEQNVVWTGIKRAWASTAVIAIAPLQDVLSLGNEARFNTPGTASGNWQWRYKSSALTDDIKEKLAKITKLYFR